MDITMPSWRPRTNCGPGDTERASMSASSVLPGLPKRCSTPSSRSSSKKACVPAVRMVRRAGDEDPSALGFLALEYAPRLDEMRLIDHLTVDGTDGRAARLRCRRYFGYLPRP